MFARAGVALRVAFERRESLFEQRARRILQQEDDRPIKSCERHGGNETRLAVDLSMPSVKSFGRQSSIFDEGSPSATLFVTTRTLPGKRNALRGGIPELEDYCVQF